LKPENILIDVRNKGSIKVIDFGTSHHYGQKHEMYQAYGTPYYIAPEVLKGKYNEKCDMWSIGVILFIMLCGVPPFAGRGEDVILNKVRKGVWDFTQPIWEEISSEAKDLIKGLIEKDVDKRLSAIQALDHPWFIKKIHKT